MMDEEIRQAVSEVREMKQMCGNINMKLTNIVTQRGQDYKKKLEAEYQRGLDDAWKAAKKIFGYEIDGGIPIDEVGRVFGYSEDATFCTADIFRHNTVSEAIAKLKAYEEQKADDRIEVGDEVIYNGTTKCIVVRPEDDERYASLIDSDGTHYSADHSECKKTGRHFDIQSILEAMKHD